MRLCLFVRSAALLTILSAPAHAAPAVSHLGQAPMDHVTLEAVHVGPSGCQSELEFIRRMPDGTSDAGPAGNAWRVPAGKLLVVTDVDWMFNHPDGPAGAGKAEYLRLFIENLSNPNQSNPAFESTVTMSSAGEAGASESMTSGFVVSSAARICPSVSPQPESLVHLLLRGYLINAK